MGLQKGAAKTKDAAAAAAADETTTATTNKNEEEEEEREAWLRARGVEIETREDRLRLEKEREEREAREAQVLLCSPQNVLEQFRAMYGAHVAETIRYAGPFAKTRSEAKLSISEQNFFDEYGHFFTTYTEPAVQAEQELQEKQAVSMVLLNAYHKAQDSSEDKPMTWTEFQKANKGKTKKQVSEECQAFKKQRKE